MCGKEKKNWFLFCFLLLSCKILSAKMLMYSCNVNDHQQNKFKAIVYYWWI